MPFIYYNFCFQFFFFQIALRKNYTEEKSEPLSVSLIILFVFYMTHKSIFLFDDDDDDDEKPQIKRVKKEV